jgi:hypothetical protein
MSSLATPHAKIADGSPVRAAPPQLDRVKYGTAEGWLHSRNVRGPVSEEWPFRMRQQLWWLLGIPAALCCCFLFFLVVMTAKSRQRCLAELSAANSIHSQATDICGARCCWARTATETWLETRWRASGAVDGLFGVVAQWPVLHIFGPLFRVRKNGVCFNRNPRPKEREKSRKRRKGQERSAGSLGRGKQSLLGRSLGCWRSLIGGIGPVIPGCGPALQGGLAPTAAALST